VLTGGKLSWDGSRGDFSTESTALPEALRGWFAEEPGWVDLTWARSDEKLSLRHSRFRQELAKVAAPMHDIAPDELESEDIRQHRRASRLRWAAIAALVALLAGATVLAIVAAGQRDAALAQSRIATARQLVVQAEAAQAADPRTALCSASPLPGYTTTPGPGPAWSTPLRRTHTPPP
jgi:hypothetical protein